MQKEQENRLKILKTEMFNYKGITHKVVDVEGKSLLIIGSNNESKSTFLQAMTHAFIPAGNPSIAIKEGEDKAEVITTIGGMLNGEPVKYSIETYFNHKNQSGRLVIYDKDGVKQPSPKQALEAIIGDVSFDIDKFLALAKTDAGGESSAGVKKQIDMLKSLLSKEVVDSLTQCDIDRLKVYGERKELNAEIKILEGQMVHEYSDEELELYSERKDETKVTEKLSKIGEAIENWNKISNGVVELEGEIVKIEKFIATSDFYSKNIDVVKNCIDSLIIEDSSDFEGGDPISLDNLMNTLKSSLKNLSYNFEVIKGHKVELPEKKEKLKKGKAWLKKNPTKPTTDSVLAELKVLQDHNAKCDGVETIKEAFKVIQEKKNSSTKMSDQMKGFEAKKKKIFSENPLPVNGLTFNEKQVLYQAPKAKEAFPLNEQQFPSSTIIGIGVKIAMAMNPNLKIIQIKDGSLLDKKMYQGLLKMVENQGFQLFVEMVSWEQKEMEVRFAESEI